MLIIKYNSKESGKKEKLSKSLTKNNLKNYKMVNKTIMTFNNNKRTKSKNNKHPY